LLEKYIYIYRLLQPLVHGYRRIPVLQIGSDIYVDTRLIMEELERRYKKQSKQEKSQNKCTNVKKIYLSERFTFYFFFENYRYPEPSIFPKRNGSDKSDKGIGLAMSTWTDVSLFFLLVTFTDRLHT
jgi:hypothetical protein